MWFIIIFTNYDLFLKTLKWSQQNKGRTSRTQTMISYVNNLLKAAEMIQEIIWKENWFMDLF